MRSAGVSVSFGKWLVDGSPSVILFDLESMSHRLNEWKSDLWSVAGIPCPSNDQEMNDSIIFGYLNAWFIGLVSEFVIYIEKLLIFVFSIVPRTMTKQ